MTLCITWWSLHNIPHNLSWFCNITEFYLCTHFHLYFHISSSKLHVINSRDKYVQSICNDIWLENICVYIQLQHDFSEVLYTNQKYHFHRKGWVWHLLIIWLYCVCFILWWWQLIKNVYDWITNRTKKVKELI